MELDDVAASVGLQPNCWLTQHAWVMRRKRASRKVKQLDDDLIEALSLLRIFGEAMHKLETIKASLRRTTIDLVNQWAELEEVLAKIGWTMASRRQEQRLRQLVDAVAAIDFPGELVVPPGRTRSPKQIGRPSDTARMVAVGIARQQGLTYAEISSALRAAGYELGEVTPDAIKARLRALRRQGGRSIT